MIFRGYKKYFYFNENTGESQWDYPADTEEEAVGAGDRDNTSDEPQQSTGEAELPQQSTADSQEQPEDNDQQQLIDGDTEQQNKVIVTVV